MAYTNKDIQLLIREFNLDVMKIESVPDSYSSTVFKLTLSTGDTVILKIPYNERKFRREKEMLNRLKGHLPVPEILDYIDGKEDFPGAFLLSYIKGNPLKRGSVSKNLAYQMGELLGKLHSIPMECFDNGEDTNWWGIIKRWFEETIPVCEKVMEAKLMNKCISTFYNMYEHLPAPDGPCIVHLDYRPGNILAEEGRILGLIDFEGARGGSADIDFAKVKLDVWDYDETTKKVFIEGYKGIRKLPEIEQTLPFYLFYNAFVGIAWGIQRDQIEGTLFRRSMDQISIIVAKNNFN